MCQKFWSRWRKEYLANVILRQHWHMPKINFQVGDEVIIKEDNITRNEWLARVVETSADKWSVWHCSDESRCLGFWSINIILNIYRTLVIILAGKFISWLLSFYRPAPSRRTVTVPLARCLALFFCIAFFSITFFRNHHKLSIIRKLKNLKIPPVKTVLKSDIALPWKQYFKSFLADSSP